MTTLSRTFVAVFILGALGIWKTPEIIAKLNEPKSAQIAATERVEIVRAVARSEQKP